MHVAAYMLYEYKKRLLILCEYYKMKEDYET